MLRTLLAEPEFLFTRDGVTPYRPTSAEVLREWKNRHDLSRHRGHVFNLIYTGILFSFAALTVYFFVSASLAEIIAVNLLASVFAIVYNTVWYHRYCSHRSYEFSSDWFKFAFAYTNPAVLREEAYVIPHWLHHQISDKIGDCYGPHLGRFGSFLAIESGSVYSTEISRSQFEKMKKRLSFLPVRFHTYEQFKKYGSFESLGSYIMRLLIAHGFWSALSFGIFGWTGVLGYVATTTIFILHLRNFNYQGHNHADRTAPVNSMYYGFFGSEWHRNHHEKQDLARSGFGWQIDFAFYLIWIMHKLRIVKSMKI